MTRTEKKRNVSSDRMSTEGMGATESGPVIALTEEHEHVAECQPAPETSTGDFEMAIRELAYFKWESAGFPEGDGFEFWLEAERELKGTPQASPSPSI
jgi:hypothetical protein